MPPVGNEEASGSPWISSLPEKLGDRGAVAVGLEERVVLLGGQPGERLEHVRVVGRAPLQRPLLHRLGDLVGERGVERLAVVERVLQALVGVLREALLLDGGREDVRAERDGCAASRQVDRSRSRRRWRSSCRR